MGYVLGLGGPYHHDASACLVENTGRVVAFVEEERFTRRKHHKDSRSCANAVAYCLATAGIALHDLDEIAVAWNPGWPQPAGHITDADLIRELLDPDRHGGDAPRRLTIVAHHLAHAASAFYPSGYPDAAVLVVDGSGDGVSTSIYRGTTTGLQVLREFPFTESLGWFYETVAEHLGLGDWTSAGKLMGLAAYGQPVFEFDFLHGEDDGGYHFDLTRYGLPPADETGSYTNFGYYRRLKAAYQAAYTALGVPAHRRTRRYDAATGRPAADTGYLRAHAGLAASAQHALEQRLLRLARGALAAAGSTRLCVAGGVGLNCTANGVLHRHSGATDLFVQPAAGDAGCALGAALQCLQQRGTLPIPGPQQTTSAWGPAFTDPAIAAILNGNHLRFRDHGDDIASVTARLLAQGHVVGWFQGPAETGPRALGHRSILADPRTVTTRDRVNRDVKRRELWRPLAPSIHADALTRFVRDPGPADFMIVAHLATDEAVTTIPATVHVDGSLRPQAVHEHTNPRYAELLTAFGDLTGIPAVLNTSFNHEAEPIVCTPADALRTFYSTPLDALAIGGFLITK